MVDERAEPGLVARLDLAQRFVRLEDHPSAIERTIRLRSRLESLERNLGELKTTTADLEESIDSDLSQSANNIRVGVDDDDVGTGPTLTDREPDQDSEEGRIETGAGREIEHEVSITMPLHVDRVGAKRCAIVHVAHAYDAAVYDLLIVGREDMSALAPVDHVSSFDSRRPRLALLFGLDHPPGSHLDHT